MLHGDITGAILCAAFQVHNTLGSGFLEKVYENALALELARLGRKVAQQVSISVFYRDQIVGEYFADLLVDDKVIVELKAAKDLVSEHEMQLLNYLRATRIEVGLLLNFGTKVKYKRKVITNCDKRLGAI